MLYNPLQEKIKRTIRLPLYYTGLTTVAKVSEKGSEIEEYKLKRNYTIDVTVAIEPENYTWLIIE
jgi:hypothetical protein